MWFDRGARRWAVVLHQYTLGGGTTNVAAGGFAYSTDESLLSAWHFAGANHSVYQPFIANP